jgi:phenylpropionate dioxygenase-like ring-hydroxylating dioxygenase large terminal subunit
VLSGYFDLWAAQIEGGLLRMQASGRLGQALDPKALSITFLTAIQGGLLWAKLQRSPAALATALDEIIQSIEVNSPAD